MWMLSLELLLLVLLVFWCVGALKRTRRLRSHCQQSFQTLQTQFAQIVEMLRSCARMQTLREQVAGVYVQHAPQTLQSSADLLDQALQQAHRRPLRTADIAALDLAWQNVQRAWQTYVQQCTNQSEMHDEHLQEWTQRWQQLHTLQTHGIAQFNTAMEQYNQAIVQFPTCAVASLGGHRAGRHFQKDAAWQMQPTA